MNTTVSPPVRIVALIGLLAALGVGVGLMTLGRGQNHPSAAPHLLRPAHHTAAKARRHVQTPARKHSASKPKHAATRTRPKPEPAATPRRQPAMAANGLPGSVARALADHKVVVVSLFAPSAPVDGDALREARAGAGLAGAGFVAVNVLRESEAGPLTRLLGVLQDPSVLVFRRPSTVFVRISGFADRETVAQAATNADDS